MALSGFALVGRAFAVWPATLQVLPEGVADAGFGRLIVGARLSNTSVQAWPPSEVRLSPRGRTILAAAGVAVSDGWSTGDGASVAQTTNGEWISVPALAAGAQHAAFLKMDFSKATVGLHWLELEIRDPASPSVTLKAGVALAVARTTCHGATRTFTSTCEEGTLTASISAMSVDQEAFRRALGKARALFNAGTPGTRSLAETERLRLRLRALLCGDEKDVCSVLADLNTSCALPPAPAPGPAPATGTAAVAILSDVASNLGDRVKIADGSVFSNQAVVIGNDAVINADVTSGGDVQLGDRSRIQGNVSAAGLIKTTPNGGASITGAQNQHAAFTSITIPTKTVTAGSTNVTVNSGQGTVANPYVIVPGNYGNVTVNSNNVISMSGGAYQFNQLIINADVTLILNQGSAAIDARIVSNLSFGDRLVVKPGTSSTVAQFYSHQTTEVRVGADITVFPLALSVPRGIIHVYSRTSLTGQLAGKTVTLEPDVGIGRMPVDDWVGSGTSGLEFLGYPTGCEYSVVYRGGFFGSAGPKAFGQIGWKALLANAVAQFDLGLSTAASSEIFSIADQAVVGTLKTAVLNAPSSAPGTAPPSSQAGSVDAAVASLRGNRSLGVPLFAQLDAAVDEPNAAPITTQGGIFTTSGFLTNTEIDAAIASGLPANLKVHKSGAGTGVTRGLISALVPVVIRDDQSGTLYFVNQLMIVPDPQFPAAGNSVGSFGDSGSVWVQTSTKKLVALTHTVGSGGVVASRIQDVANALQIQLT